MSRKAKPKPDDPKQSKRFIDMARDVEAEGSKEDLGHFLEKMPREKPKPKDERKKSGS